MQRRVLVFHQFTRKGYALFACLGREVLISVLSVATLSATKAAGISDEVWRVDSAKTTKEVWLSDIGVTGSRAPLTQSQAVRMVSVLSREDVQAAPVQSVNDLLKMAVGVDVRQRGAQGTQTDISIRGGTQEQITILLNGINICDPQTGHNVMDLPVDLSEIVRVEVLEGPAGRAYGTSSLLGAINIVTHPSMKTGGEVTIESGSFGYARGNGHWTLAKGAWRHLWSGSYRRSDGFSRAKDGGLNTDFSGSKAFYQGQYDDELISSSWYVGVTDKGWGSSTFYASPRWQADNQYEHTTKLMTAFQCETKKGALRLRPSFYWNRNQDRYEGYRGRPDLMKYNYNRCDVYGAQLNSYLDWKLGRTAFGGELRLEDLLSGNLGEPLFQPQHIHGTDRDYTKGITRTNISAHFEHNVLLDRLTLSAGFVCMRSTQSAMSWQLYPGIDVSYRLAEGLKAFAGYNSSLRLPSFTEMYYKLQGYAADPHLKPEKMQAVEVGAQYDSDGVGAKVSLYHHHGSNMIDWIMDLSQGQQAVWQSVNHTRINSYGVETSLTLQLRRLLPAQSLLQSLSLSYGYIQQDKVEEKGIVSQYALEYLHQKFNGRLQMKLTNRMDLALAYRWQDRTGTYTDFSGEQHDYQPYGLLDGKLSWTMPSCSLYAEVNNAFDCHYVDYGNVPQPGISVVAGVRYDF